MIVNDHVHAAGFDWENLVKVGTDDLVVTCVLQALPTHIPVKANPALHRALGREKLQPPTLTADIEHPQRPSLAAGFLSNRLTDPPVTQHADRKHRA